MENNIENIERLKPVTKIPVPVQPLPLIPKHLLTEHDKRAPLKTIKSSNEKYEPCCSSQLQKPKVHNKRKIRKSLSLNCDLLKHVTKRVNSDWSQNVFKDNDDSLINNTATQIHKLEDASKLSQKKLPLTTITRQKSFDEGCSQHDTAFIVTDDEDDDPEAMVKLPVKDKEKNHLDQPQAAAVTPAAPIVHKSVKNVKKSLKRPHSRELQGIGTTVKHERREDDKVKRRIEYNDEERILPPDHWNKRHTEHLNQMYSREIVDYLLVSESKPQYQPHVPSFTRACVLNWLIKINGRHGKPAVLQTACWYLDSYLGIVQVPLNKLQVIAAACYWIAQKQHEAMFSSRKMVAHAAHAFSTGSLLAAEKKVLVKLNFPRQPVVPQEFISYLCWWCDQQKPEEIEMAATFLCMAGLLVDKSLCQEFPSVIAMAAVKNALMLLKKTDLQFRLLSCPVYQTAVKKECDLPVASILRRAVLTLNSPVYEYGALLEIYHFTPYLTTQKIIAAVLNIADMNTVDSRKPSISFKL